MKKAWLKLFINSTYGVIPLNPKFPIFSTILANTIAEQGRRNLELLMKNIDKKVD